MVSLLKAWNVTVVGIECNGAAFLTSFRKVHTRNCSFKDFFFNSASKMENCITVDTVNYLMLLATGKLLATHFLFLIPFTKIWS